jgi:hypothetical protein
MLQAHPVFQPACPIVPIQGSTLGEDTPKSNTEKLVVTLGVMGLVFMLGWAVGAGAFEPAFKPRDYKS